MVDHLSREQTEAWLDEKVVQEVEHETTDNAAFNLRLRLSRLPLHVIKEETWGPLRVVGECTFDTERVAALVEDDEDRQELLNRLGPILATAPGFYTFLDAEGDPCEFPAVHSILLEHRLYPDGASQQAVMDSVMATAATMRSIQNTAAALQNQAVWNTDAEETE
ncbi:hypothetical protein [Halococcus saccharolyticus]|uniref:Uncharacterized protein n=1 Tax=Halococcus saccharolyticus DSM 5350 TaxID=1227455 RepID=M0MIM2_9EURY|nr:hypothetical protein [Halococcus saccharolyticus]EMA45213.1 hypothetical protein C449_07997 [Halococcus saccharolyticus DSM 5350]